MASVSNTASDSETLPNTSDNVNHRSSNQAPSMDDVNTNPSSPYFIPPSDVVLVSQPLIGPENYLSWSRAVFLSLSGRNKFGFLDGSISTPDLSHPLYNAWHRTNTTILSWMVNSLSKDLATSVMYIHTARELWIDMRDRFSQPNIPRFFEIQKEISKLSQGSLSVSSYFTKFKILWDELVHYQSFSTCTCVCICGSQRNQLCAQQKDQVFRFLMGLNDSYSTVISQILITEPLPALNKAYSLILQEEKRRQVGQADLVIEPTALYVNNSNSKGFQGHQGWNQGMTHGNLTHGNQSGKNGNSRKERPVCTYCGIVGHIADKCYKLHGYPPGYKHKGKASANQVSSNANGSYGSFFCNNGGFRNVVSQPMQSFANQPDQMHYAPQLTMSQPQFNAPQCPITQSQCEQLLSFLASESNTPTESSHQAASVLSPLSGANAAAGASSSTPYLANFSEFVDMAKSSFKMEHPLERRQAEAARIREKHPDRIPVIVGRAEKSDVPDIDKKKYLVPADLTVGQFVYVVRKRIKLSAEKAIFIFVKNILAPTAAMMSAIYEENKDEDGFLYMTYIGNL